MPQIYIPEELYYDLIDCEKLPDTHQAVTEQITCILYDHCQKIYKKRKKDYDEWGWGRMEKIAAGFGLTMSAPQGGRGSPMVAGATRKKKQ